MNRIDEIEAAMRMIDSGHSGSRFNDDRTDDDTRWLIAEVRRLEDEVRRYAAASPGVAKIQSESASGYLDRYELGWNDAIDAMNVSLAEPVRTTLYTWRKSVAARRRGLK